jgi:putative flippase GtrA
MASRHGEIKFGRHVAESSKLRVNGELQVRIEIPSNVFNQMIRYLCVGAGSNAVVLGMYYLATLWGGLRPTVALTLASAIGFAISYVLQRTWAFRFRGSKISSILRYSLGYFLSFAAQWLILYIGAEKLHLPHQWVVVFGLGFATVGFFVLQRYWIFGASGSNLLNASE